MPSRRSAVKDSGGVTSAALLAVGRGGAGERAEPGDSDADLLRRVAGGDQQALAELYRRHGRIVLAQIDLVAADRAFSEEVLQDTMLAAWRGAASFRGDSSVRSWLIAIARRPARDRRRRRRMHTGGDEAAAGQPS